MKLKIACAALVLVTPTLAHGGSAQDAAFDYFLYQYWGTHNEEVATNMANCISSWMTDEEAVAFMVPPAGSTFGLAEIANLTSAVACLSAATS